MFLDDGKRKKNKLVRLWEKRKEEEWLRDQKKGDSIEPQEPSSRFQDQSSGDVRAALGKSEGPCFVLFCFFEEQERASKGY